MFGQKLDTGDRVVIFKKINKDIPSYVTVRGWKAFIMYRGPPETCRSCGKVGHFAKDCSSKRKPDEKSSEDQDKPEKKRMSDEKFTGNQDIPVNMEITEPSVIPTHEQVIKDLMDTLAEIEPNLARKDSPDTDVEIGPDSVEPVSKPTEVKRKFTCYLCKLKFGSIHDLLFHRKEVHSESDSDDGSGYSSGDKPLDAGDSSAAALPQRTFEGISKVKPLGAKDSLQGVAGVGEKKRDKKGKVVTVKT